MAAAEEYHHSVALPTLSGSNCCWLGFGDQNADDPTTTSPGEISSWMRPL